MSTLLAAALLAATPLAAAVDACDSWPAWQRFRQLYVSEDGRVIDAGTAQRITVSEGQAYALLFALIGNDRATFAKTLHWTDDNLAGGSLQTSLPAWKWGHAADGAWTVLDSNSASDADLWMAYALLEAGRLWQEPAYTALGHALSERILREEVAYLPGLGAAVLPGAKGFVVDQSWRLNPSYLPIEVLRVIAREGANPLWDEVLKSSARVLVAGAPHGFAADWIGYRPPDGFVTDTLTQGVGSYDAIRVYLWAGMLAHSDPLAASLRRQLAPMLAASVQAGLPPESVDTATRAARGAGPPGFSAALLPLLAQASPTAALQAFRARAQNESLQSDQHYYSDALALFGLGWIDGRYRFDRHGNLEVEWTSPCHVH